MIFLGFLLAALLFGTAVALGGLDKLATFVDTPSLLFIVSGLLGFIFFFGRKEFGRSMRVFFAFSFPPSGESVETGRFFLRLTEFTLAWGLWGMVLGDCVWTMSNLDPHRLSF